MRVMLTPAYCKGGNLLSLNRIRSVLKDYFLILIVVVSVFGHNNTLAQNDQSATDINASEADIAARLAEGIDKMQAGDMNAALENFDVILGQQPNHPEANYRTGIIYMRQNKFQEGIDYVKKAINLEPQNITYHLTLASAYEFNRFHDQAIQAYEKIVEIADPASAEAKEARKKIDFIQATQLATKGEVDKALPVFIRLAAEYQDDALILYSLGLAYLFKKEFGKAEIIFKDLIRLSPDNPNIYLNLASVYEQQGDLSEAANSLRKVVEISPAGRFEQQAKVRLGIIEGRLLMREGNLQEALEILNGVIEISPNNLAAMFAISEIYQMLGQLGESEASFKKIIEISPNHLEARLRLAGIYVETNKLKEGIDELETILNLGQGTPQAERAANILERLKATRMELMDESQQLRLAQERYRQLIVSEPDNLEAHFNLGRIYYRQGMLQEARLELEEVVRIDPDNKQGQIALGALYDELGMFDLAIKKYSTIIALEEDKENADRYENLMELAMAKKLYVDGDLGLAREKFEKIISEDPGNALAHFYLGLIHASEEDLSKAVDAYEEVIRLIPGHVGARLNLAINFERLHREEDAISQYRKILEAGPPVNIAETAEQRLVAVERRIRGLSTGMSYSIAADTNSNLSEENPTEEYRSDLSVNISYQYKMENDMRLRFVTSPTYSTYHVGQFDFLNTSSSISATVFPGNFTLVGGFTNRTNRGLVSSSRFSDSHVLFGEGATRLKLPRIFSPLSGDRVMSDFSLNLSYTDFESNSSPFFSAFSYTAGMGINQPFGDRSGINLGYSYTINDNKETLGNDYAYISHGLNIGYERGISPDIVANARYGYSLSNYSNLDSVSQFTQYRKNDRHTISVGGSYRFHDRIRFFANLSWTINKSNLPIGFILNAQDVIEGQQSTSLGEYSRGTFTMGMNLFI